MSRSLIEQETVISFNAFEEHALVGTCRESVKNKLSKRNAEVHRKDGEWITYKVPKTWIKISPPRFVSDAQRSALSDRMKALKMNSKLKTPKLSLGETN